MSIQWRDRFGDDVPGRHDRRVFRSESSNIVRAHCGATEAAYDRQGNKNNAVTQVWAQRVSEQALRENQKQCRQ